MTISADRKALLVARARIKRAAAWISAEPLAAVLDRSDLLAAPLPEEMLACMDALVVHATALSPRGAFWRELERAAEYLGRRDRALEYRNLFVATIVAKSNESQGSGREV